MPSNPNIADCAMYITPEAFGQKIRQLHPGCPTNNAQLADWHRRVALSLLPRIGMTAGSRRAIDFIVAADL